MLNMQSISEFYSGKSVFITGGSGFIGKVLIEKLLSSCPDIGRIYLLIRSSRDGKSPQQRLREDIIQSKVFQLRNIELDHDKLVAIGGDMTKQRLGISDPDYKTLTENVSIVFHSAATVRFNGPLKKFIVQNIFATESVMKLARNMKQLQTVVYVSTAYANCNLKDVEEKVYPLMCDAQTWIDKIIEENSDETPLEGHPLLMDRPNSYTVSKAVAEALVKQKYSDLPVVICRPSIVTNANAEPAQGWCDSYNGLAGTLLLSSLGISRTMKMKCDCKADIIPVDFVANSLIVIGYHSSVNPGERKQVVHITSSHKDPLEWGRLIDYFRESSIKCPSIHCVRPVASKPIMIKGLGTMKHYYHKLIEHILFAYVFDFILFLLGKQRWMIQTVVKLHRSTDVLEYFTNRQWSFSRKNYEEIYHQLSTQDKSLFQSNPDKIVWRDYCHNLYMGIRRYLLNEDDQTIKDGRVRFERLFWIWTLINGFLLISMIFVGWFLVYDRLF